MLQTVLVVDDNELYAHQTRASLEEGRGIFINSAREALAELHEIDPDLILLSLDLTDLPGMRSIDVFAERNRVSHLALSQTPTITEAVEEQVQHGAIDYLRTPIPRSLKAVERATLES